MDTSNNDIFFNRQYLEAYASNIAAKGFITGKYLPRKPITAGKIVEHTRDVKEDGKILSALTAKARPVTEGAELTQVRGSAKTGKAMVLDFYGLEYKVTPELEEDPAFDLETEVMDLSYTLGALVEQENIKKLLANAKAPVANDIRGDWVNKDINEIQSDIIDMQEAFDETDYTDELTGLFYNKKQYNAIRKHLNYSVEKYQLPEDGYISAVKNPIEFVDSIHHTTRNRIPEGKSLGFDLMNPPATIYYGIQSDTFTPETYQGLEDYAPLMRAYIKEKKGIMSHKTIELGVAFGLSVRKPATLQLQNGL